jgi:hypothetical protein
MSDVLAKEIARLSEKYAMYSKDELRAALSELAEFVIKQVVRKVDDRIIETWPYGNGSAAELELLKQRILAMTDRHE